MATPATGSITVPCISKSGSTGRVHRFNVTADGGVTADLYDSELIAELVSSNTACMTNIPNAIDAVRYRTAVIQRRESPCLTLGILTQPTEPWTESATWSVAGQRGCCLDGFYLSFRNAVGHLLGPSHLAAEFGSTSDAVKAVIQHLGAPETHAAQERMAPEGNDHWSEDVLDVLWEFGIDAERLAPAPWTTRAFPEAQLIACEIGRAYSYPRGLRSALERQEHRSGDPYSPDDWANLMLGRDRSKAFSLDLGISTTPATNRKQENEHGQ